MNVKRHLALMVSLFGIVCASWAQTVPDSVKIKLETSAGAEIGIDGELSSTNIMSIKVPVGKHKVIVNYGSSFQKEYDIDVKVGRQKAFNFPITGKLNVNTEPSGASVYVDGINRGTTPMTLDLIGRHTVRIIKDSKKWYDEERVVDVEFMSEKNLDILMKKIPPREYVKHTHFYLEGEYQFMDFSGYGVALGGYLNDLNAEFGFSIGGDKKNIYWYDQTWTKKSCITYKTNRMHLKVGYGIKVGNRIQVTPQVGGALLRLSGDDKRGEQDIIEYADDTYAVQWIGSLRMTCAILPCLQLVITPEYTGTFKEGALFEKLSTANKDIKGWGSGFSIKTGLAFYF